jgi:hypothetical protein
MRSMINALWKELRQPIAIVFLITVTAWQTGFWFTKGSQAAGGMLTITINYSE